jgi:hypothetical protein
MEQYTTTSRGRTLMSVIAVSPEMRHHFLAPLTAVPGATQDRGYRGPPVDRGHPGAHLPISVPLAA